MSSRPPTTRYSGITGKRNLRGALELVAGKIDASSTKGVQAELDQLEKDTAFVLLLEQISEQHNLRKHDVLGCLKQGPVPHLKQRPCMALKPTAAFALTDMTALAEWVMLIAIFEHHNLSYACMDGSGARVIFHSPPTC